MHHAVRYNPDARPVKYFIKLGKIMMQEP